MKLKKQSLTQLCLIIELLVMPAQYERVKNFADKMDAPDNTKDDYWHFIKFGINNIYISYGKGGLFMNKANCIIELNNWRKALNGKVLEKNIQKYSINNGESILFEFPYEGEEVWYLHGFEHKNNATIDLRDWYGLEFDVEASSEKKICILVEVGFYEIRIDKKLVTSKAEVHLVGNRLYTVSLPFEHFDYLKSQPNKWKYVKYFSFKFLSDEINDHIEIVNIKIKRRKSILLEAKVKSKSAEPNEYVEYEFSITNCENRKKAVKLSLSKVGWEAMPATLEQEQLILEPYETKINKLRVLVVDRVAKGGYEKQIIYATANGDGKESEVLEFITVRKLPHPYIIHTEEGWKKVKEKVKKCDWAKEVLNYFVEKAENWVVPDIYEDKPYLFDTFNAHTALFSAIAWKITGEIKYAQKVAQFLVKFSDPEKGYVKTQRACHQSLVQEGEFFMSTAKAYDLIYDLGLLTEEDHKNLENAFRVYMKLIDYELNGGWISNWDLNELAGAAYCSLVLQDLERFNRFIFGNGGAAEHLSRGVFDDGWWYECSIGYNLMAAGLFTEIAQACKPWGINFADVWVPATYSKQVNAGSISIDGLVMDIWGPNTKNYRCISQLWDSLIPFADYRSVIFGVNDAAESKLVGADMRYMLAHRYDIAYYMYKKPEYADVLKNSKPLERDLLFGAIELPESSNKLYTISTYADNAGVAVLRSQTEGRAPREQIQVAVKYGSHGGAHGHYDRVSLLSIMRYGRSFYNPENIWYGYGYFMYKFFVQTSITHNMVVVDLKLQDPSEARRLLFHSGKMFQACALETISRWSNPPYGGWKVKGDKTFEERIWNEGRYVPIPQDHPEYTKRSDFTEPILQRRLTIVTDDYIVLFDYMKGEKEHTYDCLFHIKGFMGLEAEEKTFVKHTAQLTKDPLSSAQFYTDCEYYKVKAPSCAKFEMGFGEGADNRFNRTLYNEDGILKMDVYSLFPEESDIIIACAPENNNLQKQLYYEVIGDGKVLSEGKFGAWILGKGEINVSVENIEKLVLKTKVKRVYDEDGRIMETNKSVFWGDPYIITSRGEKIYIADLPFVYSGIDPGNGIGVDYYGGPVKILSKKYDKAIPAEPKEKDGEGEIIIDLKGLNAKAFVAVIGSDYPLGDETYRRRTLMNRQKGREVRFISIIEPYESNNMILRAKAIDRNTVQVELKDGRVQVIRIENFEGEGKDIDIEMVEYRDGQEIRKEKLIK